MTLEPLFAAPIAVQVHVATVVPAFLVGTWQIFLSTKGSKVHRKAGYVYLSLMTATSIAALFVNEINPGGPFGFSLVHLFVPLTLLGVAGALYGAKTHNLTAHRSAVYGTYFGGILIAGAFAFSPGRIMHAVVFG